MRRTSLSAIVLLLGFMVRAHFASATVTLDQESYSPPETQYSGLSNTTTPFRRVQTFTVGVPGKLHHIDIYFLGSGPTAGPEARIIATVGGLPTETILASTTILTVLDAHWQSYDFTASALEVQVGDVLGIELMEGGPGALWVGNLEGQYPGGVSCAQNPFYYPGWDVGISDKWFRTFVEELPVPSSESTWGGIKASYR